jgi:hypothetical protein
MGEGEEKVTGGKRRRMKNSLQRGRCVSWNVEKVKTNRHMSHATRAYYIIHHQTGNHIDVVDQAFCVKKFKGMDV